ncbi:MAG: GNAT family N-acetyltransferase, partial [Blastocatellia bacterium]
YMKIEILMGHEAERLIEGAEFRGKWRKLSDKCPWGSVFQGEDFVVTWYAAYRSQFTPVIVTGASPDGELAGLFTLAVTSESRESGQLVVAGTSEAEYQAWLSAPRDGNRFIESALEKLCETFPNRTLTLLFVLPTVPVEWTATGSRWARHCHVNRLPRGLMKIGDGSSFNDTLRKKKQSKINRFKRLGNLHLDRIQDPEELGAVFDEIIPYQTLRLRAVQNLSHVKQDPFKKTFYMNLLRLPRMIHATALRVDDRLASAQIHNYDKEQVRLGLIAHSPFFARYSPGELHTLMIGVELAKEEIHAFDLTPGGHYKDRYATHHDEVYAINVFFNRAHCIRYKIKRRLAEAAKSAARAFNITPEQARDAFSTFLDWRQKWLRLKRTDLLSESFRRLKRSLWHLDELCIYARDLHPAPALPGIQAMKRDHIPDLLAYQPMETWQLPVNQFLKRSLRNLEAGHHIYTRVEDGKLVQYGWLIEPQSRKPSDGNDQASVLPPGSVLLGDFYTSSQDWSLSRISLRQMLRDAAIINGAREAYICVSASDPDWRQVVEEAGFSYQYSIFKKNVLGKVTRWSTAPQSPTDNHNSTDQIIAEAAGEAAD